MPTYRVGRTFTVESGHLLSQHPERCRFPHGHTRTVEVVVAGQELDSRGMLVDFKALKLALEDLINQFDHAMAINSQDPLLPTLQQLYPADAVVVFDNEEPTTEVIARFLFERVKAILEAGFHAEPYQIWPRSVTLERLRVSETPTTWAEVSDSSHE
jgi:6-pyruvoyltetrahydropterin/6-carboxytetrahydropterin synthase